MIRCLVLMAAVMCMATVAGAEFQTLDLNIVSWRVSLLGRGVAGEAALVSIPGEGWRLAVTQQSGGAAVLLEEQGDGWTLVGEPGGRVWLNDWHGPTREVGLPMASTLQSLVRAIDNPDASLQRVRFSQRPVEEDWNHVVAAQDSEPSLRSRLSARARGRGGPSETLMVSRLADDDSARVRASSRRRHGLVLARVTHRMNMTGDPAEVLLPVWPLAELLMETVTE